MRQDVVTWLQSNGVDVNPQILQGITSKNFRQIFQDLVNLLDPTWSFDADKRFEEQFMNALRALQYPYIAQIDLKWLATPAAMPSWPSFLGLFHWLSETGRVSDPCRSTWVVA